MILSDEIIFTKEGGQKRYLIRWRGKPESEDIWLERDELQRINSDALEIYESTQDAYSMESSLFQPRENDEDIRQWKVLEMGLTIYGHGRTTLFLSYHLYYVYYYYYMCISFIIIVFIFLPSLEGVVVCDP